MISEYVVCQKFPMLNMMAWLGSSAVKSALGLNSFRTAGLTKERISTRLEPPLDLSSPARLRILLALKSRALKSFAQGLPLAGLKLWSAFFAETSHLASCTRCENEAGLLPPSNRCPK